MVRGTDRPAMTIAVDLGRKATKQTNKTKQDVPTLGTRQHWWCHIVLDHLSVLSIWTCEHCYLDMSSVIKSLVIFIYLHYFYYSLAQV